ncbi:MULTISPECIES: hypothetical protein [unclassified Spiroplasma]|uniref:hypothetical protein n=1 Tax=unclassified Spiroplasma TaxID=2637901 RepID=UPI00313F3998
MNKFLLGVILYQNLMSPLSGNTMFETDKLDSLIVEHNYSPTGWHRGLSANFMPIINRYNFINKAELMFSAQISDSYGWWNHKFELEKYLVDDINKAINYSNSNRPVTVYFGVDTEFYFFANKFYFYISINNKKQHFWPNWGTWYKWNKLGGVELKIKFSVSNELEKHWNQVSNALHNKPLKTIITPDPLSGNNESNQKRTLQYIEQEIGKDKYKKLVTSRFNEKYVELIFQDSLDGYTVNKKINFYFEYKLWNSYEQLEANIKNVNNILEISTTNYSLKANEQKIVTAINNLYQNKVIPSNLTKSFNFIPSNSSSTNDTVDVYFELRLLNKFCFSNSECYAEKYRSKKTFQIKYKLDADYYQKNMQDRLSLESTSKPIDYWVGNTKYKVYGDDVYIKFLANEQETEALYVNGNAVGVSDRIFNYVLKDGRLDPKNNDDNPDKTLKLNFDNFTNNNEIKEELNIYKVEISKGGLKDAKGNLQNVTYTENIMIVKKAPKLNMDLWAKKDEQNPNEMQGIVIYEPAIDDNFSLEQKWLKDNEFKLLQGVNGLSGSLMAIEPPTVNKEDDFIDTEQTTWEFMTKDFNEKQKDKFKLNFKSDKNGLLINENEREYFSDKGIFRFKVPNKLGAIATYYHLNLGISRDANFITDEHRNILSNIKDNLYYFWDSKLGSALINYLRGPSWYFNETTNQKISWDQYKSLTTTEQKLYVKERIKDGYYYTAEQLLNMPLDVVHFNISRMIRDLQYDIGGVLEKELKETNGGKDELDKEDKRNKCEKDATKCIADPKDDNDKVIKPRPDLDQDNKIKEWDKEIKNIVVQNETANKRFLSIILATTLTIGLTILSLGTIIYFRKRKKII